MKKIETKEDLDAFIAGGITSQCCADLGAYRVDFLPFRELDGETKGLRENIMNGEFIEVLGQDLETFTDCIFSTIYKGIRWHFETGKQLENFCRMVGQTREG